MSIGQKLFALRKEKNLSQEEVADKLNVSRQTVSKWETDQSLPDFDKIIPLCELYEITADELLNGKKKTEVKTEDIASFDDEKLKRKKRASGIGIGVFLYFVAIVWIMITVPVMMMNPIVSSAIFLLICGGATFSIVYTGIVYKSNIKEIGHDKKESEISDLQRQIDKIICVVVLMIYLGISFMTMAWHITWILWVVYALVVEIVKLLFMLGGNKSEK